MIDRLCYLYIQVCMDRPGGPHMKAKRRTGRDTCCRGCARYSRGESVCVGDRSPCHADPMYCYGRVTHQPMPVPCSVCPRYKEIKQ